MELPKDKVDAKRNATANLKCFDARRLKKKTAAITNASPTGR
jgi:hypothetical protein